MARGLNFYEKEKEYWEQEMSGSVADAIQVFLNFGVCMCVLQEWSARYR